MINIGYGNLINQDKVIAVINADSAPAKRIVSNARGDGRLVDATQGRKTKTVIITEGDTVVTSSLTAQVLRSRFDAGCKEEDDE